MKTKRGIAISQIFILIVGIIAFSYVIGSEVGVVSGALKPVKGQPGYYSTTGNLYDNPDTIWHSDLGIVKWDSAQLRYVPVTKGPSTIQTVAGVSLVSTTPAAGTRTFLDAGKFTWKGTSQLTGDIEFKSFDESEKLLTVMDSSGKTHKIKGVTQEMITGAKTIRTDYGTEIFGIVTKDGKGITDVISNPEYFTNGKLTSAGKEILKGTDITDIQQKSGQTLLTKDGKVYTYDAGGKLVGTPATIAQAPYEWAQGWTGGYFVGHLAQGLMWSVTVISAIQLLGSMFLEKETKTALSYGAFAGIMAGKFTTGLIQEFTGKQNFALMGKSAKMPYLPSTCGGVIGLGVGITVGLLVFQMMYEETSKKIVTFNCYGWQAPVGGGGCEECNSELYPCSEYRCKSLGQACGIVNKGTDQEKCVWLNPKDVSSPTIQPWEFPLTKDHVYSPNNAIRPPDRGVKILSTKTNEGCVKAFTPLSFGIKLNEPAQCKVDYNRTNSFDEMTYFFGGDSLFEYNHSMTLRLPSPDSINAEVPQLMNDGTYNLYVKCQDGNSNSNDDLFVFSFCVEKGPDVTPPIIEATSIENGAPFQYELDSLELEIYINEPAECKWSKTDQDYENMETDFSCSSHVWEMNSLMLYKCTTTLTGLKNKEENKFYFKCKDQPILTGEKANDRNTNVESYEFVLIGTQPLDIMEVSPNGTIKGASSPTPIFLEVKTDNGYNFGDAWCYYSLTENTDDYIQFFETGTSTHKQRLDLPEGDYTYYFSCTDKGGNTAQNQTSFSTKIDVSPPEVVRAYKDSDKLKIITDEKSSCSYQTNDEKKCNFILTEATNMPYTNSTEHVAEWLENKNYYIKCVDINGREPLPTECSIVVKPSDV